MQEPLLDRGLFGLQEDYGESGLSLDSFHQLKSPSVFIFVMDSESMAPLLRRGDFVIVDRSLKVEANSLGIFYLEGERICRRLIRKRQNYFLSTDDPKGVEVRVENFDQLECFGRVIGLSRSFVKETLS